MEIKHIPQGTCSRQIDIKIENGVITELKVCGGCNGNLQGVAALCKGRTPAEVISALRGIRCGNKNTSCPDQIALALESEINS